MLVIDMMLSSDRDVFSYIKRRQGEPLTTQQISEATGVHYQTVRKCLKRLRSAGLIDSENTQRKGRRYWPNDDYEQEMERRTQEIIDSWSGFWEYIDQLNIESERTDAA
jgi:predicted transcriptional regulator